MPFLALLSDRSPDVALPALLEVAPDLKLEPLSLSSLPHALELEPEAILVDAGENVPQAWSVLTELRARDARIPAAVWSVWAHGEAGRLLSRRQGTVGYLARELLAELPALVGRG